MRLQQVDDSTHTHTSLIAVDFRQVTPNQLQVSVLVTLQPLILRAFLHIPGCSTEARHNTQRNITHCAIKYCHLSVTMFQCGLQQQVLLNPGTCAMFFQCPAPHLHICKATHGRLLWLCLWPLLLPRHGHHHQGPRDFQACQFFCEANGRVGLNSKIVQADNKHLCQKALPAEAACQPGHRRPTALAAWPRKEGSKAQTALQQCDSMASRAAL